MEAMDATLRSGFVVRGFMFGSASRELELRFMGKCARLEENPHTLESHVLLKRLTIAAK